MNNFNFCSPTKIFFGKGRESEIGDILNEYNYKKILIHYGQQSVIKSGLLEKITTILKERNIEYILSGGVSPNPQIELVQQVLSQIKSEKIDMVLAIGGGSVIDSAKLICCGYYCNFYPFDFNLHKAIPERTLPLGVVLTISAAGSELSNSCVISRTSDNLKLGFNSDLIRPKFAILNPELTYTVSQYQTACGIVDILMHTFERYFNGYAIDTLAKYFAIGLIQNVLKNGLIAFNDPTNYQARSELMLASSFSHNGLTGLGMPIYFTVHKLEHELSGRFDSISHGAGLSVLFIAWAKWVYQKEPGMFDEFAEKVFSIGGNGSGLKAILKLRDYFKMLKMPLKLSELNIKEEKFALMADHLTNSGSDCIPGFIPLNKHDIIEIFKMTEDE